MGPTGRGPRRRGIRPCTRRHTARGRPHRPAEMSPGTNPSRRTPRSPSMRFQGGGQHGPSKNPQKKTEKNSKIANTKKQRSVPRSKTGKNNVLPRIAPLNTIQHHNALHHTALPLARSLIHIASQAIPHWVHGSILSNPARSFWGFSASASGSLFPGRPFRNCVGVS